MKQTTRNNATPSSRGLWADAGLRLLRDRTAVACFAVVLVYAIIAVVSPMVFPHWGSMHDYLHRNAPPSWAYPLGPTRWAGRCS